MILELLRCVWDLSAGWEWREGSDGSGERGRMEMGEGRREISTAKKENTRESVSPRYDL